MSYQEDGAAHRPGLRPRVDRPLGPNLDGRYAPSDPEDSRGQLRIVRGLWLDGWGRPSPPEAAAIDESSAARRGVARRSARERLRRRATHGPRCTVAEEVSGGRPWEPCASPGSRSPCITPSTETFVLVVSFMVAAPFSLVDLCRTDRAMTDDRSACRFGVPYLVRKPSARPTCHMWPSGSAKAPAYPHFWFPASMMISAPASCARRISSSTAASAASPITTRHSCASRGDRLRLPITHPKPRDGISITRNPTLTSNCRGSGSPSSPNSSPTVTNPRAV